ncbi:hypothetical protein SEVIR_5G302150v4 [Setaria viridis]|uniref:Uncharacterized protein n=1 Tax=Setaria viridis TaxID=4556 RepID=A0A4U6UJS9_SETVI|nr:hypothetical protein SEVIR_5G302150v2 [Setaria viridis]
MSCGSGQWRRSISSVPSASMPSWRRAHASMLECACSLAMPAGRRPLLSPLLFRPPAPAPLPCPLLATPPVAAWAACCPHLPSPASRLEPLAQLGGGGPRGAARRTGRTHESTVKEGLTSNVSEHQLVALGRRVPWRDMRRREGRQEAGKAAELCIRSCRSSSCPKHA